MMKRGIFQLAFCLLLIHLQVSAYPSERRPSMRERVLGSTQTEGGKATEDKEEIGSPTPQEPQEKSSLRPRVSVQVQRKPTPITEEASSSAHEVLSHVEERVSNPTGEDSVLLAEEGNPGPGKLAEGESVFLADEKPSSPDDEGFSQTANESPSQAPAQSQTESVASLQVEPSTQEESSTPPQVETLTPAQVESSTLLPQGESSTQLQSELSTLSQDDSSTPGKAELSTPTQEVLSTQGQHNQTPQRIRTPPHSGRQDTSDQRQRELITPRRRESVLSRSREGPVNE